MAELYLDDAERRIIANMTALVNAARAIPAVETKAASVASFKQKEAADEAAAAATTEAQAPESPSLTVMQKPTTEERVDQLKYVRESNYETRQNLLKGEKPKVPAEDENFRYDYIWHVFAGGGGEWRLIKYPKFNPANPAKSDNSNDPNNPNDPNNSNNDNTVVNGGQTTNIDVLKSLLRSLGYTTSLVDSSANFLNRLLKDGLDYDNAISIFLDSKEYTFKNGQKETSPFYTAYGYLNEGLTVPKSAADLFNSVEGYKEVIAKYSLNEKFISSDSLKKYIKNDVSVTDLDARANAARLKAVNADPAYTSALMQLGYIKNPTDLTDFFLNPDIGKEALEQNRATAAFSTEAIRRAQQGVKFDATRFGQIAAGLVGQGLNEAQIGATAATGFENISQQLMPTQKLAGIYERMPASEITDIQKELEAEQFLGTASQRRKRLSELETRSFQSAAGTTTSSLKRGSAGII